MIPGPLQTVAQFILASGSPRRRDLLRQLGLEFEIVEAGVEEQPLAGEAPEKFVQRAAGDKAAAVSRGNIPAWVLGADTVVVFKDRILGKPRDAAEALEVLQTLSGRRHLVHTAFSLRNAAEGINVGGLVTTEVIFSPYSREIAAAYVAGGEPLDKAGAYGIQGRGSFLVERIYGSYSNVVGLPLAEVVRELLCYRVVAPREG